MKPTEFIDTYSDDILYLYDMREALLTHPFKVTVPNLFYASFSRIYCVFIIGNIEAMIKEWSQYNDNDILSGFFDNNKSNTLRIENLYEAFVNNEINVDKEILQDYLAIKYLRNTVVHSGWNENQKKFILERNFPIDSRDLNDTHLQKMKNVNENMMVYIMMTSFLDSKKNSFVNSGDIIRNNVGFPETDGIITKKQFPNLIWNNLSRIISRFELIFDEAQSEANNELLYLSEEALFFWNEYKRYKLTREIISKESIETSLNILQDLLQYQYFIKFPIGINNLKNLYYSIDENQISEDQLITLFKGDIKYSAIDSLKAIIKGEEIYNSIPNITILKLFVYYLPRVLPEEAKYFIKEAKEILTLFKLSRYYYHYIEQNSNISNLNETIQSFEDKINNMESS